MKRIVIATVLSTALLAAPLSQAASNQDRAMATGAVIGATAGGVVGSGQNRAFEGAIFGILKTKALHIACRAFVHESMML